MAHYLQLIVLTEQGRLKLEENPDWFQEVNKDMELMGAKVVCQYSLLGQWDMVSIMEAPSDEVAAKISIKLSAAGFVQPMTLAAIPLENLIATLKKDRKNPW
jgi:uncharacterized protein with GYD domain